MKQEKKQQEQQEVSIAPINISNKFVDINNVVQAPLFRVLARGHERKKDVKIYSSHKTYDLKTKQEVELHWRFDLAEELGTFDFKLYLYLLNKYIQEDLTEYVDLENLEVGQKQIVDILGITNNTYICNVPLRTIVKDLGYVNHSNEDKQRILDSLIRLQKVFIFFSDKALNNKKDLPSKIYSKNMFYHYMDNNNIIFRIDNNIAKFVFKYLGINDAEYSLQFARYNLEDFKKLKHEVSIALYNYINSKDVSYSIDGLREVVYGFLKEKNKTYYNQRSSIKKGLEELKKIWTINIDGEKVYVIKK